MLSPNFLLYFDFDFFQLHFFVFFVAIFFAIFIVFYAPNLFEHFQVIFLIYLDEVDNLLIIGQMKRIISFSLLVSARFLILVHYYNFSLCTFQKPCNKGI